MTRYFFSLSSKVARCRGVHCIVEQPISSLAWQFEPLADALSGYETVSLSMANFLGDSAKPLHVRGPKWLDGMRKFRLPKPKGWAPKRLVDRDSSGRVHGNRNLKGSQAYTFAFGCAFVATYMKMDSLFHELLQKDCNNMNIFSTSQQSQKSSHSFYCIEEG